MTLKLPVNWQPVSFLHSPLPALLESGWPSGPLSGGGGVARPQLPDDDEEDEDDTAVAATAAAEAEAEEVLEPTEEPWNIAMKDRVSRHPV